MLNRDSKTYRFIKNAGAKKLLEDEINHLREDYERGIEAEEQEFAMKAKAILDYKPRIPKLDEFGNVYY